MVEIAPIIKDLAIVLILASLVALLFQAMRQPAVLGYLVAGIIVGPYSPPFILVSDVPNIKVIAELGVIFLMFSLGLEFSFAKLKRVGIPASITGIIEVAFMIVVGFLLGKAIGWSAINSLFLGAAISISSTTIIVKALNELHLKGQPFADLVFGILIIEDMLAILILAALSAIVTTHTFSMVSTLKDSLELIAIVGTWFIAGYFFFPFFFARIMAYANQETLTILSIACCLLLVCFAAYFHYSTALGAFIMGSILAETQEVHRIERLTQPIRDIFGAVFFVSVGMLIDPAVIYAHFSLVLLISMVTIIGKILTTSLGVILTGQGIKSAVRVSFSMTQIGEFSFIIIGMGVVLGETNAEIYPIIVAVSVITTFCTPYFIRLSTPVSSRLAKYFNPQSE